MKEKWSSKIIPIHRDVYDVISDYIDENHLEISSSNLVRLLVVYGDKVLKNEMYRYETKYLLDKLDLEYLDNISDKESFIIHLRIRTKNEWILNSSSEYLYRCLLAALYSLDTDICFLDGSIISYNKVFPDDGDF